MYVNDFQVKKAIFEDMAVNRDRDVLLIYLAAWQMQPYIRVCFITNCNSTERSKCTNAVFI